MPRIIPCETDVVLDLGDVIEGLAASGFDTEDNDAFAAQAPLLKGLANNRSFLAEIAMGELKARCQNQVKSNGYSAQVIMLYNESANVFVRANFWPSIDDNVVKQSGVSPFFYHVPHDHNFSFLTVGYLGPGYWSNYYEYDYEDVIGYPGEKVNLRFVEKSRLEQGKVMLYRAHRDVHDQLPADSMSISINIMESSSARRHLAQYRFDTDRCEVAEIMTTASIDALIDLAAHHGGPNGLDLITDFSRRHPNDRIRFNALKSLASAQPSFADRSDVFRRGTAIPNLFVQHMCTRELRRMEAGRSWLTQ